jgi:hypothetical protein
MAVAGDGHSPYSGNTPSGLKKGAKKNSSRLLNFQTAF